MRFRLKDGAGNHNEDGRTYKAGEVVESISNLAELFPFKFEVVPVRSVERTTLKTEKSSVERDGDEEDAKIKTVKSADSLDSLTSIKSKLGTNVTKEFPKAEVANLIVLKRAFRYRVADPGNPDVALTDPLKQGEMHYWLEQATA